jgi:hypothetical protein
MFYREDVRFELTKALCLIIKSVYGNVNSLKNKKPFRGINALAPCVSIGRATELKRLFLNLLREVVEAVIEK